MDRNKCIFITGATGNCGRSTIKHLCEKFPQMKIMAAVRDTKKAKDCFQGCRNLEFCQIESPLNNPSAQEELCRNMKGCGACMIIPPAQDRVEVGKCYIDAAKKAGVDFVCMISSSFIDKRQGIFNRQFKELEDYLQRCELRHCVLRCDFFMDNHLMDAQMVKAKKCFSYPVNPDAKFTPIACCDIGDVAAHVLVNCMPGGAGMGKQMMSGGMQQQGHQQQQPMGMGMGMGEQSMGMKDHKKQIVHLSGCKPLTMTELAAIYSKMTKTDVKFVQCSKQEALQTMTKMGMPQWQAEGMNELWDAINDGMCQQGCNTVEQITGKKACTMEEFLGNNANVFSQ